MFLGYGVAKLLVKDEASFNFACRWLAASAALAGAAGLYTFYFIPFRGTVARATGAFGNPNGLANYLTTDNSVHFLYLRESSKKPWQRILSWLGVAIAMFGAFRTASKGGMAGAMAWPIAAGTVLGKRTAFFVILMGLVLFFGPPSSGNNV